MIRPSLALVIALVASACVAHRSGSSPRGSPARAELPRDPDPTLVCSREQPTGSHIANTVCYTPEDLRVVSRPRKSFVPAAASPAPIQPRSAAGAGQGVSEEER